MRIYVFPFVIGNFSQSMGANRLMTEDLVLRTARYWSNSLYPTCYSGEVG